MNLFNTLFPTSNRAVQMRGMQVAGGTGPVRRKQAPNLLGSIFGVFIGLGMLVASPVAMWQAQSQDRAKEFVTAVQVEPTSGAVGYVVTEGVPAYATVGTEVAGKDCVDGECLYQKAVNEEQFTRVELECSNNIRESADLKILRQNGAECDSNGDCVPCYDVEKKTWEEQMTDYALYPVTLGGFTVEPTQDAEYLELREKIIARDNSAAGNPQRTVFSYMPLPSKLLVAGESDGKQITEGEEVFVLSAFGYDATLEKLEAIDRSNRIALYAITFMVVFVGLLLVFGPLAWLGSLSRFVPVVGPMLSRGSSSLVAVLAVVLAIPIWVLIFAAVTILKVWWVAVIAIVLVGLLIFWAVNRARKQEG